MGRKKKNSTRNMNIAALILIIFAIVFAVLIYTRSGYIGKQLSPALGGVFGYIKYFIPIFLLVGAVKTFIDKDTRRYKKKIIMILIILILIDVVLATSLLSKNNVLSINDSLGDSLSKAFDEGKKDSGGGVIGTLFAVPLVGLFGVVPTIIIAIGFALVMAVYIFDLHPIDTLSDLNEKKKVQEAKYDKRDKKEAEREALRIQKLREKEEKRQEALANRKRGEDELEDQITINIKSAQNGTTNQNVKGVEVPNFTNVGEKKKHSLFNLHKKDEEEEKKPEVTTAKIEPQKDDIFKQEAVEKEEKTKEVLQIEHARLEQEQNYEFPPISILGNIEQKTGNSRKELLATAEKLRKTLQSFGVNAKVENVSVGPAITRYELAPAQGVRVSKIANLADDIALSLEAETIRIEAPIPGKHTVGIEVPNKSKSIVPLRDIIESDKFISDKSKVAFALGKDVAGEIMVTEINKMPHLLIAGSTGSGKSVCINTLITSILYKAKPSEVKLLMIDPKVVELSVYNGIPHLLLPVVTDPKKASGALVWAVKEMENRYSLFAQNKVRDIKGYNEEAQKKGEPQLPQMVIIIDELADLMMVAAKDVEDSICRLAQMARAAGMFLVIATQRPSVDVITGIIKANIPSRIAFAVSSQVDSRTILDGSGAEKLLGKGDMLFFPSGAPKPVRIQGAFVSDKEVENLVNFVKRDGEDTYDPKIMDEMDKIQNQQNKDKNGRGDEEDDDDDTDPLLNEAIEMVIQSGTASTSYIQRRFKVGYARAGRIIDQMEERGVISGYAGSKPREVIMTMDRWRELNMAPGMDANSSDGDEDNKSI